MASFEKRRSSRVDIDNFISYYLLDEDDKIFKAGFGKAKDISNVGLLIVTEKMIETDDILVAIIDERNHIIEMNGKVRHSRKDKNGESFVGIELIGDDDKKSEFAELFKKVHRRNQD